MVSFKSIAVLFLASATSSFGAPTLRPRKLSAEFIAGYEPKSEVTDQNAIDMDQKMMEIELALGTAGSFANAQSIYKKGAHSKSIAVVTVSGDGLSVALSDGDQVEGKDQTGKDVIGTVFNNYAVGDSQIEILYDTTPIQDLHVGCQVGASTSPKTDGCFADSGSLLIGGVNTIDYTYDVSTDNRNGRSLQTFSTRAKEMMYDCPNCPYTEFSKFYNYYEKYDYANQIVMAAFENEDTDFRRGNLNLETHNYSTEGRVEIIKKATAFMHVWMMVIGEMEKALDHCQSESLSGSAIQNWDSAVAYYVGSLEGTDGSGSGVMPFSLADLRCVNFNTCGDLSDSIKGTSYVNVQVMQHFQRGQRRIQSGQCEEARASKERIVQLMTVPLIQGTLRYADRTSQSTQNTYSEKSEAEGAIFAAAVVPLVHACSEDDAQTIHDNMRVGQNGRADYQTVKTAFENNYECLGIKCAEVGGLFDMVSNDYFEGAGPCEFDYVRSNDSEDVRDGTDAGLIAGFTAAGAVIFILSVLCCTGRAPLPKKDEREIMEETNTEEESPQLETSMT